MKDPNILSISTCAVVGQYSSFTFGVLMSYDSSDRSYQCSPRFISVLCKGW